MRTQLYQHRRKLNIIGVLLSLLLVSSCTPEDGIRASPDISSPVIEITFEILCKGSIDGQVQYNTAFGEITEVISSRWEKTIKVAEGHNLYFRTIGELSSGLMEVKTTAKYKSSGETIFSDLETKSSLNNSLLKFDVTFKADNLGQ